MSIFGTSYQAGLNAARARQVSEEIWSALHQRSQQNRVQQQSQALHGQLQATLAALHAAQQEIMCLQQENGRLRKEHAELSRFSSWATDHIERLDTLISDQGSMIDVMLKY